VGGGIFINLEIFFYSFIHARIINRINTKHVRKNFNVFRKRFIFECNLRIFGNDRFVFLVVKSIIRKKIRSASIKRFCGDATNLVIFWPDIIEIWLYVSKSKSSEIVNYVAQARMSIWILISLHVCRLGSTVLDFYGVQFLNNVIEFRTEFESHINVYDFVVPDFEPLGRPTLFWNVNGFYQL